MKYNQPYYERVLVCIFSKKGTWTEKDPGTLGEVRGIFHQTKPMCSRKAFVSVGFINLLRKMCIIFKKGMKPSFNIHRLSSEDCVSLQTFSQWDIMERKNNNRGIWNLVFFILIYSIFNIQYLYVFTVFIIFSPKLEI